ncbi:efflux RND transporter periplasmic adaptor subunit [Siphonobacter sp.]|uniref:efflux RND transporter periplasmic adaptor subunit n=1 Tax=Siphonobacter sp. TaxID=1869184 RepID=UPI003B3B5094
MKKILLMGWVMTLVACQSESTQQQTPTQAVATAAPKLEIALPISLVKQAGIQAGPAQQISLSEMIQANGTVEAPPQYVATISAPLGGFVKQMNLLQGSYVEKGQVVLTLEHPDYIKLQQEYLQALSRVNFLEQEFDRQAELAKENVGARRKLEQSESEYTSTKALVASLEAQLRLLGLNPKTIRQGSILSSIQLRAPFSGYVRSLQVNIGKHVNANESLMEIVNKQHLHVELQVFEKDINKVKEGQLIRFTLPQMNSGEQTARVELVAKTFDGQTKTVQVHGHLSEGYESLVPGSYVRARIVTSEHLVTAVPSDALVRDGNRNYVYVVVKKDPGQWVFKKVPVQTGTVEKGYTQITLDQASPYSAEIVQKGSYFISAELAKAEG